MNVLMSGAFVGFCVNCGQEHFQVEPDAENYECEICGKREVHGAEIILIMQGDV
jgi:hypothetical protein